jgi:hypothetical protein
MREMSDVNREEEEKSEKSKVNWEDAFFDF